MKLFHYHIYSSGFWIRMGKWSANKVGNGISVSWEKPIFSIRAGYQKHIKIGSLRIAYLPGIIYKGIE